MKEKKEERRLSPQRDTLQAVFGLKREREREYLLFVLIEDFKKRKERVRKFGKIKPKIFPLFFFPLSKREYYLILLSYKIMIYDRRLNGAWNNFFFLIF